MPKVLIIGAAADVGRELCHLYGKVGYDLVLAARNINRLEADKSDYEIRYNIKVELLEFDVTDYWSHEKALEPYMQNIEGAIYVAGYLGDHEKAKADWDEAQNIIDVNYSGAVSALNIIANSFEKRQSGWIVGISSVAGDRGRGSNYYYGSAKAAFSSYLSGLRSRLSHSGFNVLTVKPGFIETKMVAHFPPTPKPITASAQKVAKDTFKAQQKKKNVIYTVWPWFWIMVIIKHLPESIFKKLKF